MAIKVVTDSTSDVPRDLAESLGITVVPLNVHFGTETFKDGVDLNADDFYERLVREPEVPKTSQPSVGDFLSCYEQLGKDAEGIVSLHISSKLSGTYNSAIQAKQEAKVGCPIEVLDTYQVSMSSGRAAIEAALAARDGAAMRDVIGVAQSSIDRTQCIALFDTLEYLQKGGRIGKARALLGSLLNIKPMIVVRDGEVHELAKERTRKRGIARLEQEARSWAPLDELCVLYSTRPEEAQTVARDLADLLPEGREPLIARFGPVIGTYAGPGALGLSLLRAKAG